MSYPGVSIVIPTWNGKVLLQKNLPLLFRALSTYPGQAEVIVVDDAGIDDTGSFIRNHYPEIRFRRLPTNVGNGQAMNEGAKESRHEILFFLDNDVSVTDRFLETVALHFKDPDLFAVGCRAVTSTAHLGPFQFPRVRFRFGIFWYYYEALPAEWKEPVQVLFASAGHAAYRRNMFEKLGGFDPLYGRFYLEDLDLCYRAWKQGWKSFIDPRSHVIHEAAGTIRKILSEKEIKRRQWRNRFLFTWKNINRPSLILEHIFMTPFATLVLPFMGKPEFSLGLLDALGHLGEALRCRKKLRRQNRLSDQELLQRLGSFHPESRNDAL